MLICPYCGAEDLIEGEDLCPQCQQPLGDAFLRVPSSSVEADLVRDTVGDLPTKTPTVVGPTATVGEALRRMVDGSTGCVLVVVEGQLAGVFSERDALLRLGVDGVDRHDHPVVKYMTPNPTVISADDKISQALHKMDLGGYRHLPVMDGGKAVNVVSIRDILQYLTEHDR